MEKTRSALSTYMHITYLYLSLHLSLYIYGGRGALHIYIYIYIFREECIRYVHMPYIYYQYLVMHVYNERSNTLDIYIYI